MNSPRMIHRGSNTMNQNNQNKKQTRLVVSKQQALQIARLPPRQATRRVLPTMTRSLRTQMGGVRIGAANLGQARGSMISSPAGTGSRSIAPPVRYGRQNSSRFSMRAGSKWPDSLVISGSEYLQSVPVPVSAAPPVGTTLLNLDINPLNFLGSRLKQFATLFEKYCFTKLVFRWVPSVATSTNGQILLVYDRDPSDATPPPSEQTYRQFRDMQNALDGPVWDPFASVCPLTFPTDGFFTNEVSTGDARLVFQGQLYVVAGANLPSQDDSPATSYGTVEMDYECHLFVPALENLEASADQAATQSTAQAGVSILPNNFLSAFFGQGTSTTNFLNNVKLAVDSVNRVYAQLPPGNYDVALGHQAATNSTSGGLSLVAPVVTVAPIPGTPVSGAPSVSVVNTADGNVPTLSPGVVSSSSTAKVKAPTGAWLYADVSSDTGYDLGSPFNRAAYLNLAQVSPNAYGL